MEDVIINADFGERVTSYCAETYYTDLLCDKSSTVTNKTQVEINDAEDEWESPSDALIGVIELKPPFTSKITRGKTHEGILSIGEEVLARKRAKFDILLNDLLQDNDFSWNFIFQQEKKLVEKRVADLYRKIFILKSKIMSHEMSTFLEGTLQTLEDHIKCELKDAIINAHSNIVRDLNIKIKEKLLCERKILEDILQKKHKTEIEKVKHYYKLLLNDQVCKQNNIINASVLSRNDALKAFSHQLDAETLTSTMYIMSMERKKCTIQQFIIENYQEMEIKEKLQKIKEREDVMQTLKEREIPVKLVNKQWEDRAKKILQMFVKFSDYFLKLLPEQGAFLLDFEKLLTLQMNEIRKTAFPAPAVLMDMERYKNTFKFEESHAPEDECVLKPFVIELNLSDPTPVNYGSRESLASDVDLPFFRLQKKFVYAECHRYHDVKKMLASFECQCMRSPSKSSSPMMISPSPHHLTPPSTKSSSIQEPLLIEDTKRLKNCPSRRCQDFFKKFEFPNLDSYMDYTEENYNRVKILLENDPEIKATPELLKAKDIAYRKVPFSETKELNHNVATQYSSQETIHGDHEAVKCNCIDSGPIAPRTTSAGNIWNKSIEMKRKQSIKILIEQHPKLLKFFTDECFDFQL